MLDIEVLNEKGKPERPWLTVVLDDYSRAVAGFYIDFKSPDTLRTTLTLRKAIWRKENKNWPICGIPEIFIQTMEVTIRQSIWNKFLQTFV